MNCVPVPEGACYIDYMHNRLRSLLLCLLIFSLPLQSVAGMAKFACAMTHSSLASEGNETALMLTMRSMDDDSHEAGHEHTDSDAQNSAGADQDCEHNGNHAHGRSSCGTCASCSIGAYAPPPVIAVAAIEEAATGLQQFSSISFTGHIPYSGPRV